MRLVLIALLVLVMAGAASAADLSKGNDGVTMQFSPSRSLVYCTGIDFDSAFYQNSLYAYGNALSVGPTPGPLTTLDFIHYGYGFAGPYDYTLWVYDAATCTVVGSVPGLVASNAASEPIQELVDLCSYNIVVSDDILVLIQPLTCLVTTDCYPDVTMDDTAPVDGCGSRATVGVAASCVQLQETGGIVVDLLLGVTFDECLTGACCVPGVACSVTTQADCVAAGGNYLGDGTTCGVPDPCAPVPVVETTWGAVKALYR